MTATTPLAPFHPIIRRWFGERFGEPTDVQAQSWPVIAEGANLLATAPTGSGKTLAAFLWSLDRLLTGTWSGGRVRVLYVSPLKALNNDVERNLVEPLADLQRAFEEAGGSWSPVRVATRSGDTSPSDRQKMLRRPPEILITTPESLNILLTSRGGRGLLDGLEVVILDEVHSVAAGKRGTHLITAVDRLVLLSGEFQRIALSATVRPLERIARFVAGWQIERRGELVSYSPRPIEIREGRTDKVYEIQVDFPDLQAIPRRPKDGASLLPERPTDPGLEIDADLLWEQLTQRMKSKVRENRSTLIFANSRRLSERVTHQINDGEIADLVYSHHGSLARDIRTTVEEHFKAGKLAGIVATNSLELGIDIGDLDEVILLQTPFSIASAVQRVGRAGHAVGAVSRGTFYPLFGRDLISATVVARAIGERDIEPMTPVRDALDVLAQIILSMTSAEEWGVEELYEQLKTSYPFHQLPRAHYDLVLEMLAGRYADTRLRELTPRIHWNRLEDRLSARRGAARLLYTSGGTIPDRGYYQLRVHGSMARIGELDEEFVWERKTNDRFTLGTQSWRVVQITHHDVIVAPTGGGAGLAPFWRGEGVSRDAHLADRINTFLEWAEDRLSDRGREAVPLRQALVEDYPLSPSAADQVTQFLESQRAATGTALPHRRHLLVERVRDPQNPAANVSMVLHTGWGGRVNRPYAIALASAWEERFGSVVDITQDDDALMIDAPHDVETAELLDLVAIDRIEVLLRSRLERSGFFGARFRENAGRALLLPRAGFDRRVPLWFNRQRSKKLLESVAKSQDFPIVLETWRTCLQDEFDLEALRQRLEELLRGTLAVTECTSSTPSPFASGLTWHLTNRLMYEDDAPEAAGSGAALGLGLLRDLVEGIDLAPKVPARIVASVAEKLQRTAPGYSPRPGTELVEWVKERLLLPWHEWLALCEAIERDHGVTRGNLSLDDEVAKRLVVVADRSSQGAELPKLVVAVEGLPRWLACVAGINLNLESITNYLEGRLQTLKGQASDISSLASLVHRLARVTDDPATSAADFIAQWLRYEAPIALDSLAPSLGLSEQQIRTAIEDLESEEVVVVGTLIESSSEITVCDSENLQSLLRTARRSRRPQTKALPLDHVPLFLAIHQGVAPRGAGIDGMQSALDHLFFYPAPVAAWEEDLLPARLDPYQDSWLDTLMQEGELVWRGTGQRSTTLLFRSDLDLFAAQSSETDKTLDGPVETALSNNPALSLGELVTLTNLTTAQISEELWQLAWKGRVTNDTYASLRRGIASRFAADKSATKPPATRGRRRRPGRSRWGTSRPFVGRWSLLASPDSGDRLEQQANLRERARLVLHRYGIVFRELLERELRGFRWSDLFRSLRLMELSGEIVSGHFFEGIPGPQFGSKSAVRRLQQGLPEDLIYWMVASDPASPSGLGLEFSYRVPRRLRSNTLVFHGSRLVLVLQRGGHHLEITVEPEHPQLADYLAPLRRHLGPTGNRSRSLEIETINGLDARDSAYRSILASEFHLTTGAKSLRLWRRY